MKRSIFSLFLALLLIVSLAVLSPAVYATGAEASVVSSLYVSLHTDIVGASFMSFSVGSGKSWSSQIEPFDENLDEHFYVDDKNRVYFYDVEWGHFRVVDSNNIWQYGSTIITDTDYYLQPIVTFSIEEHYEDVPSGVKYILQITRLASSTYKLQDLIDNRVIIYNEKLGDCRFVLLHNGSVALRVGIRLNGDFAAQYLLVHTNGVTYYDPEQILASQTYYAFDVCETLELHNWKFISWVTEPTCTEAGESAERCEYCGDTVLKTVEALGHDRNILGVCQVCGDDPVGDTLSNAGSAAGGAVNAVGKWFGGLFGGGSSGEGSEGSEGSSGGGNWFTNIFTGNTGGGLSGTLNSITKLLGVVLIFVLLVILIPVLKPLLQALVNLLKALISTISSGAKKLSKWAKSKSKKAKKKKTKKDN